MASLIFAAGVLSYDAIKKKSAKRSAKKASRTGAFSDLERENAARIANLQSKDACFCQRSDWRGGGCEAHGYVPAAGEVGGPPLYSEIEHGDGEVGDGERVERRRTMPPPPEYRDGDAPFAPVSPVEAESARAIGNGGRAYVYRRGREEGALASRSVEDLEEVRRINEERRGRGRGRGKGFLGRWRRGGDGVVR